MKNNKTILVLLLVLLLIGANSCRKTEEPIPTPKAEVPIRVLTSIELGGFSQALTRADGGYEPADNYSETKFDGSVAESKIHTIRLIAFDESTQKVAANVLYHHPTATAANVKKYKFSDSNGINISKIQLDLKLFTGFYEFVLIANEDDDWNLQSINNTHSKSDFEGLTILKGYTNKVDLVQLAANGIPMIGRSSIVVPAKASATPENPYTTPTKIELKRTIAKLEVRVSNVDETTNAVYETAKQMKLKRIDINQSTQVYNVSEADQTSFSAPSTIKQITINHNLGHTIQGEVASYYMAERKNVDESSATRITVVLDIGGTEKKYEFLLYQKRNGQLDYNIYRNSIYRFNFIMKGNDVLEPDFKVLDWSRKNSEINFLSSEIIMESTPSWKIDGHLIAPTDIPTVKQAYNDSPEPQNNIAELTFKIVEPEGAKWRVTLTNGLEFAFLPDSAQEGEAGQEYTIKVIALKKPSFTVRKTELYFTVNGKEQDPDKTATSNGPKSTGKGNRYLIQQAAQ